MTFFNAIDFVNCGNYDRAAIADRANELLKERGIVVYGGGSSWLRQKYNSDTHQALLVAIEEIKKELCEHIPVQNMATNGSFSAYCKKCNVWLKPTGWEEA